MIIKDSDKSTFKWLYNSSKKQVPEIIALIVVYCLFSSMVIIMAWLSKGLVDSSVSGNHSQLIRFMIIVGAVVIPRLLLSFKYRGLNEHSRARLEILLRQKIFTSILQKDYSRISDYHSGELLNRLINDIGVIVDGAISILPSLFGLLTKLLLAFFALFSIEKKFALVFAAGGVLIFVTTRAFRKVMKRLHKDVQQTEGVSRSFFQEALENSLVIKVFGAEKSVLKKSGNLLDLNYKKKIKRILVSIFANLGMSAVFNAGYYFAFFWGAYGIYTTAISYGTLTAVLQLVNQIQSPVSGLSGLIPRYYSLIASAERLIEIENLPREAEYASTVTDINDFYEKINSIEFKDITFAYKNETVIEGTSLSIKKGEFVAVAGISGIGKSTLLKLLLGVLIPNTGSIYFNLGTSKRKTDKGVRGLFAYVPQGNMLLSGTILENVTFLNNNKTDKEIRDAIRISCMDSFVDELPDGLNTVIGERGKGLSEGQVQRIAIARAILSGAPILLLDEATAALDEKTEKKLLENIRQLENKTCIIISHKHAAIEACDKEVRIVDKKIVLMQESAK
ncbi:MAG: ABC transporter ATP-binding protein [Clostridiales bacterium]|nr:ABC transporter ATP-binding protein [Clostridiales bacterium]